MHATVKAELEKDNECGCLCAIERTTDLPYRYEHTSSWSGKFNKNVKQGAS